MERYDYREFRKKLEKKLDPKRYEHSIGVAYTATALAMRYGVDIEQAYTAGLLHDCAKCLEAEDRDRLCKKYDVELTDFEKENPFLIHAKLGAALAKHKYGVEDEEILSSIIYHTTGKPDMTMLEKIIFSADFIEPNRKMLLCLPKIRSVIFEDIDRAVYLILKQTIIHLGNKKMAVDEHSQEALRYYERFAKEEDLDL